MSRRFQYFCDIHGLRFEDVPIDGDELFGYDGKWYTFGACDDDKKMITQAEFKDLVIEHGIELKNGELPAGAIVKKPKGGASGSPRTVTPDDEKKEECLWCPKYRGTIGALQYHVRTKHGFNGFIDAYGDHCPMCNDRLTGLGQHGQRSHGVRSVAHLFEAAREAGDPFGIVAARVKAGS